MFSTIPYCPFSNTDCKQDGCAIFVPNQGCTFYLVGVATSILIQRDKEEQEEIEKLKREGEM